MLAKAMVRPERFLRDVRAQADHLVLSAEDASTPDLVEGQVQVQHEDLRLHEHSVRLWRYEPVRAAKSPRPCFVHLHGGGWFVGRPSGRDNILRYVADRADAVVFDLDYSLSPEVKFPHAVEETYGTVEHLHANAASYGIDPARIVVGGGSAGANLTAAATLLAKQRASAHIAAQVLIAPALHSGATTPPGYTWSSDDFDVEPSMRRHVGRIIDPGADRGLRIMVNAYRGRARTDNPLISPALAPDLAGLPPAVVLTCEMDSLRPQGEYYAARLARAGVPVRAVRYRGIKHETPGQFGVVPQAEAIALEIVSVLRADVHGLLSGPTAFTADPQEHDDRQGR